MTHAWHGELTGRAQVTEAALPAPDALLRPSVIEGRMTDAAAKPIPAEIKVESNGALLFIQNAQMNGDYRLLIYPGGVVLISARTMGKKAAGALLSCSEPGNGGV